jgi:hypothetical protein
MSKNGKSGWLVLKGDWGGQIYLTVPAKLVGRGADIATLLRELDAAAWSCNEGDGASYYYAKDGRSTLLAKLFKRVGRSDLSRKNWVIGGMGGGYLTDGLWLHEEFSDTHWTARARELLKLK